MKRSASLILVSALWGVSGCGDGRTVVTVRSGSSIQAAVAAATDNMIIEVEPGTYRESIDIPANRQLKNFTLRGKFVGDQRVILDGSDQATGQIQLQNGIFASDVTNFTVEGFQVQNYRENGIWIGATALGKSRDLTFRNNIVDRTGKYGIFPQAAVNALVEKNKVTRVADAGIYVGQSEGNLIIQDNEVAQNVAGIECENSNDCVIRRNNSHDNTGGILVFTLPGLLRKECLRAQVYENTIENNNTPNFASQSDIVYNVPSGSGVTIIGADQVTVRNNTIRGNQSYAAAVVSLTLLTGGDPIDVNPDPENDAIRNNTLSGNGTADFTFRGTPIQASDFLYDGSGTGNCQAGNGTVTQALNPLPSCP
ncbi:MAG TPA: parallel beta-helix domain-containing protein [Polyangia bacterium]|nr:parallel beta-helix domain-containing protein [Polyangia bacterium]